VTFLRRVREGPTDRSYGVHVADLAGVPGPVVARADEVLDRLREEKAIEARGAGSGGGDGETRQAVFDLSAGEFVAGGGEDGNAGDDADRPASAAGNGAAVATTDGDRAAPGDADATESPAPELEPEAEAVLSALRGTDVNETPPVELMAKVQEWQERLDGG
uniref:MutS-related protein n=1 Tax=Halobaculum sp. EA56 TaxID=3421648 RepID=UPI003EB7C4B1